MSDISRDLARDRYTRCICPEPLLVRAFNCAWSDWFETRLQSEYRVLSKHSSIVYRLNLSKGPVNHPNPVRHQSAGQPYDFAQHLL
jgi:hypothetical protein